MRLWIAVICFHVHLSFASQEGLLGEHNYDKEARDYKADGDDLRMVGAKRANVKKLSFLVGLASNPFEESLSCTGSLITSTWVVSAAHCIFDFVPFNDTDLCLQLTRQNQVYSRDVKVKKRYIKQNVQCHLIVEDNLIVTFVKNPAIAYIGLGDMFDKKDVNSGERIEIDAYVRHVKSYQGVGYGTLGGYDITLLHLSKTVPTEYKQSCLPGPVFQDSAIGPHYISKQKAHIAGYGSYFRTPCLTDQHGPVKFHFCSGKCQLRRKPPRDPVCQKFLDDPFTPNGIPVNNEELFIETGKRTVGCYRSQSPEPGSHGWCRVNETARVISTRSLKKAHSWGFCSKDCNLTDQSREPRTSVLREVLDINILDDNLCNMYLKSSLPESGAKIAPEILCIGRIEKPKFTIWQLKQDGFHKGASRSFKHPSTLPRRKDIYVRSVGTCHGDSGGPVFVKDNASGRFVTLGATSGGRGALQNCGGMNNPTHYVRLKKFVPWMKKILSLDSRDLCIIN